MQATNGDQVRAVKQIAERKPGELIICRRGAPLVSQCINLIQHRNVLAARRGRRV